MPSARSKPGSTLWRRCSARASGPPERRVAVGAAGAGRSAARGRSLPVAPSAAVVAVDIAQCFV